jgi:dTDP-4-dehydrorhamnose 3,5-epimerase
VKVIATDLPEVLLIEPHVFEDDRGFFMETFNAETLARATGLSLHFPQDNHSRSRRGVLRGLHYQLHQPQGKMVRVVNGEIFDVAVDLRRSSPTFGRWVGFVLSGTNRRIVWIPPGFGHGFLALSESTDVLYKTTTLYDGPSDRSLLWNDPQIGIEWPLAELDGLLPLLSTKDRVAPALARAEVFE